MGAALSPIVSEFETVEQVYAQAAAHSDARVWHC